MKSSHSSSCVFRLNELCFGVFCFSHGIGAVEINEFGKCFGTNDMQEGTTAFLEKRKPNFKGN